LYDIVNADRETEVSAVFLEGQLRFLEEARCVNHAAAFDCGERAAVVTTRGDIVESEHHVCHIVVDKHGAALEARGDVDRPVYMRSSAKPLICATIVASGAADRFAFSDQEIAIAAGSHSGEPYHVDAVESMLRKIGLDESALQCGAHAPIHEPSAQALCKSGESPSAIHNNCSGKHAAILALAVHRGAPVSTYLARDNPAQAEILASCAELLQLSESDLIVGTDGCGIPVIAVSMRAAARFYAKLAEPDQFPQRFRAALARLCDSMTKYPQYVAGSGRFDTDLMRTAAGTVVCKGGAEGYHASAALGLGLGMTAKVADGNYRAIAPFVMDRLQRRAALDAEQLQALERHRRPAIRNHAGRTVGEIRVLRL